MKRLFLIVGMRTGITELQEQQKLSDFQIQGSLREFILKSVLGRKNLFDWTRGIFHIIYYKNYTMTVTKKMPYKSQANIAVTQKANT